jgi:hypothetical protein
MGPPGLPMPPPGAMPPAHGAACASDRRVTHTPPEKVTMTTNAAPAAAPAAGAAPATPAPVVLKEARPPLPTGTPATPAKPGAAAVVPPEAGRSLPRRPRRRSRISRPRRVEALSKADPKWGKRFATWQRATRASREREVALTTKEKELETRAAKLAELEIAREGVRGRSVRRDAEARDRHEEGRGTLAERRQAHARARSGDAEGAARAPREGSRRPEGRRDKAKVDTAIAAIRTDIAKAVDDGGDAYALVRHFGEQTRCSS